MADCCANTNPKALITLCPGCGTTCKSVEIQTLYHQVKFPENQGIISESYYFCPSKDCATAYFSVAGNSIPKRQLTSYQDIQQDKLCYCFDIDTDDYLAAINTHQAKATKNFVIQRTKSGECACNLRNPSGQCCLAKFKQLENDLTQN